MPITIDGVALQNATAPVLFQTCKMPIVDLRRYRMPDEVIQNMPTFVGGWADGTQAPAITSQVINIDTSTNAADDCRFPIVTVALDSCYQVAPNQVIIGLESENINWAKLKTRFCKANNISERRLGAIFNADGSLNAGNDYTFNFVRFVLKALVQAQALALTHSTLVGDEANALQFDGLYNQIDNGWATGTGGDACPATLNTGNTVNWDTLTGGAGTGNASPDAVTVAGTVTLWGQSFAVPAGWHLGDFLAFYAESAQNNYGGGASVDWEMHVRNGWRMAVLKSLSCIRLCNSSTAFISDDVVERYEELVAGKIAELFGYGMTFPILESGNLPAGTLRFGPRLVDGTPTYGLVMEDIAQVLASLDPVGDALYGSGEGMPFADEPLLAMTRTQIANRFEARTIHWDLQKLTSICVRASVLLKAGLLATERHWWLKITNVGANHFNLTPPTDFTINAGAPPQYS